MTQEIALRLTTGQAIKRAWPVDNRTVHSGPCWGPLTGRFRGRELLQRKSSLRRPRAAPLDPHAKSLKALVSPNAYMT
ncbi:Pyruvate/2-oxoglutarate dehydrogenase complex, dehydrogenase (E1) component, eukaryotic type, beta subunit (plasmid) [Pseudomonas putida]|uniref:Pyruvate/2-oxoglutarate dehydrogenase complex, dehydrogenase (E1) component, eukaryotic type, beta subunit n=1 Tax=Pseudomonas putida TaxID=303 RepID=A0A1L7NN58_PSEPU|nr:Pyruvate/2-oxoglutarate dehydrogenase complex, dehydrogenase (E1) component, eukaryotic type, beta subunit [Pseudomonas putida]